MINKYTNNMSDREKERMLGGKGAVGVIHNG